MNSKIKTSIISIVIVGLLGAVLYFSGSNWLAGRLTLERNVTILQLQNEVYKAIKTDGMVKINAFEADEEGAISIIDTIVLVESYGK